MVRKTTTVVKTEPLVKTEALESSNEVTRCICGNEEFVTTLRPRALNAIPGLYVQCERCNVWQHGVCMGFEAEAQIPDEYYCELCEPSFHRISHRNGGPQSRYRPKRGSEDVDEIKQEEPRKRSTSSSNISSTNGSSNGSTSGSTNVSTNGSTNVSTNGTTAVATPVKVHEISQGDDVAAIKEDEDDMADAEKSPSSELSLDGSNITGSAGSETQDGESKKRSRRKESDADVSFLRSRKRRSREDVILQRVLEESAREAREAEALRRSREGGGLAGENEHAITDSPLESRRQSEADAGDLEDGEDSILRPRNRRRRSTGKHQQTQAQTDDESIKRRSANPKAPSRSSRFATAGASAAASAAQSGNTSDNLQGNSRPTRGNRNRGTATPCTASGQDSPSKRTAKGSKKCKPRVPSQRSTLDEMRRRVAAILDFSSRTQAELAEEQSEGLSALKTAPGGERYSAQMNRLFGLCDQNVRSVELLTERLLKWEETYGVQS